MSRIKPAREIRKLNALRGIAALIVVLGHYGNHSTILGGELTAGGAQFGVMLFFILSGFLMGHLYLGQSITRASIRRYAVARMARVVPLYCLVVLSSWALYQLGFTDILYFIPGIKAVLAHLLMLWGVSVLWTIPPEIQFYVLFCGFWWLWQRRPPALYLLLAGIFATCWYLGFPRPQGKIMGMPWDFSLPQALPYFAAGLLMGSVYGRLRVPAGLVKNYNAWALLLIPMLYPGVFTLLTGMTHGLWRDPLILLLMSSVFFVIVFLVPDENRWLANRAGDFFGRVSYSLYLWHLPVLLAIKPWVIHSPWLSLGVFLLLSLLAARISYQLVENPCRRAIRTLMFNSPDRP